MTQAKRLCSLPLDLMTGVACSIEHVIEIHSVYTMGCYLIDDIYLDFFMLRHKRVSAKMRMCICFLADKCPWCCLLYSHNDINLYFLSIFSSGKWCMSGLGGYLTYIWLCVDENFYDWVVSPILFQQRWQEYLELAVNLNNLHYDLIEHYGMISMVLLIDCY